MTANEILAIAEFLGDGMTESQADRLMDAARQLSIADRELLHAKVADRERMHVNADCIGCRKLYTALSENSYELGWRLL